MATYRALDLGLDLNDVADSSVNTSGWLFMMGCRPWNMVDHALAWMGEDRCPICLGARLRKTSYCLGCDRSGLDGKVEFAGLDVDSCPDPDYPTAGTIYVPNGELAGGVEARDVKISRRVVRSRKAG